MRNAKYRKPFEKDAFIRAKMTGPQKMYYVFIDEIQKAFIVNNVLKLSDIGFIDKEDLVLVPIIEKYTSLFEDKRIRNELYTYLGFKGNTISYNFLINEFKKTNDYWDRNNPISWNFTRRWAISNSQYQIVI